MAEFTMNMFNLRPSSVSFFDVEPNMDFTNQFLEPNASILESPGLMMGFPAEFLQQPSRAEFAWSFEDNNNNDLRAIFLHEDKSLVLPLSEANDVVSSENDLHETKKRKTTTDASESSSAHPSTSVSENNCIRRKNSLGKGKRSKNSDKDDEKPKEVVHVRAKRGQATDSHSLAERVRRGKINERLRCLQDIVPGCYKNMGMAVMLEEIINYVQSLQNQVEFLSMKLTAASSFYDFNTEADAIETMQREKAYDAQKVKRTVKEGYSNEGIASEQVVDLDHAFGSYHSFPYHKMS